MSKKRLVCSANTKHVLSNFQVLIKRKTWGECPPAICIRSWPAQPVEILLPVDNVAFRQKGTQAFNENIVYHAQLLISNAYVSLASDEAQFGEKEQNRNQSRYDHVGVE